MTFEELVKKLTPKLKGITYRLKGYSGYFDEEDLYQEALIHLFNDFNCGKLSDKTDSYILQGCFFHLKNYLRTHFDRAKFIELSEAATEEENVLAVFERFFATRTEDSPAELTHCSLLLETINNNGLTAREKDVFNLAFEGLTTREIGGRLGISHVRVIKLRKSIAEKCRKHMDIFYGVGKHKS